MFPKIDKILSAVSDYHLPILSGMFIVGSVLHYLKTIDSNYVAFTGLIVGGVTGHAFSKRTDNP